MDNSQKSGKSTGVKATSCPMSYYYGGDQMPTMGGTTISPTGMTPPVHDPIRKRHSHGSKGSHGSHGQDYLQSLVGMLVKINRGGPDSLEGTLIAVQRGYLVLSTPEGTVYINITHVKSITEVKNKKPSSKKYRYIVAGSFVGVLHKLVKKYVQINWGGPEKIEGFIAEVGNSALLLVVGQELVRIPLFHIKTVKHTGKYASNGSQGTRGSRGSNGSNGSKGSSRANAQGTEMSAQAPKRSFKPLSRRKGKRG
jgi:spore coat protein B